MRRGASGKLEWYKVRYRIDDQRRWFRYVHARSITEAANNFIAQCPDCILLGVEAPDEPYSVDDGDLSTIGFGESNA